MGFDTAASLTSLLYSGEQFDQKLAMQYLRARYYDAATGRFNRIDPFSGNSMNPISLHKYIYAHDNPISQLDPTGQFSILEVLGSLTVGTIIATVVSAPIFTLWSMFGDMPTALTPSDVSGLHKDYALISLDVYSDKPRDIPGWKRMSATQLRQLGIPDSMNNSANNFAAALYQNGLGDYALAFRGTESSSLESFALDWGGNIAQLLLGHGAGQYRDAVSYAEAIASAVGVDRLTVIGHSLGGGLASAASLRTGAAGVTFNAAGLNPMTRIWAANGLSGIFGNGGNKIAAYHLFGEALTTSQIATWQPDAVGRKYVLYPSALDLWTGPLGRHSIEAVLRALRVPYE